MCWVPGHAVNPGNELIRAISSSKNTAPGPDEIHSLMLKNLPWAIPLKMLSNEETQRKPTFEKMMINIQLKNNKKKQLTDVHAGTTAC